MKATKQMKCCVCEIEIDNGMDYHNPDPLGESNDVCCTYCNITKVIPKRLEKPMMREGFLVLKNYLMFPHLRKYIKD